MAPLTDEQLRALRTLAHRPAGITEAKLLQQGFTAGQLSPLVIAGLVNLRRGSRPTVLRVKITAAGRKAIVE
jgi:hypothetical protein